MLQELNTLINNNEEHN